MIVFLALMGVVMLAVEVLTDRPHIVREALDEIERQRGALAALTAARQLLLGAEWWGV